MYDILAYISNLHRRMNIIQWLAHAEICLDSVFQDWDPVANRAYGVAGVWLGSVYGSELGLGQNLLFVCLWQTVAHRGGA